MVSTPESVIDPTGESTAGQLSAAGGDSVRLWRLVKTRHVATAFDGEGAFRFGGRWNTRGRRVVYASGSLALALLEVLVHLDCAAQLPKLSAFPIKLPRRLLQCEDFSKQNSAFEGNLGGLPWTLRQTRVWGDAWCDSQPTPALAMPSAIVPIEMNYLLNPQHPEFTQLEIGEPQDFEMDARLF